MLKHSLKMVERRLLTYWTLSSDCSVFAHFPSAWFVAHDAFRFVAWLPYLYANNRTSWSTLAHRTEVSSRRFHKLGRVSIHPLNWNLAWNVWMLKNSSTLMRFEDSPWYWAYQKPRVTQQQQEWRIKWHEFLRVSVSTLQTTMADIE